MYAVTDYIHFVWYSCAVKGWRPRRDRIGYILWNKIELHVDTFSMPKLSKIYMIICCLSNSVFRRFYVVHWQFTRLSSSFQDGYVPLLEEEGNSKYYFFLMANIAFFTDNAISWFWCSMMHGPAIESSLET